jgi:MYXO-CTERM domain-containing protein
MRKTTAAVVALLGLLVSPAADALEQPGGAPIPSAMGCDGGAPTGLAATFACVCETPGVCNIGAACPGSQDPSSCDDGQNAVCETTIWHAWNDDSCVPSQLSGLDPWTDGATVPETFQPTCPLTFTVLTRGTARFQNAFGWYNVTGEAPGVADLHVMLDCDDPPGTEVILDVQGDPRYLGGAIGFFLLTPEAHGASGQCAGDDCCARVDRLSDSVGRVYYSERGYNPDASGATSLIHLVVFDSAITERKFYFAWEDTFGAANNDFTDLVTSVQGVECSGGGERCDTGMPGVCGVGLTACRGGALDCVGLEDSGAEMCNALDDDCDGTVDEDATCPDGEVCDGGRCLPHCELGEEFQCPPYAVCDADSGRCVDPDCVGVSCPEGAICLGGDCVEPCDGIVCPHGQRCDRGECRDPCAGIACPDGQVCREGICLNGCGDCAGLVCSGGLACSVTGECEDPSCPGGCPDGTFCDQGECVDACEGAVCPAGQMCVDGACCRAGECPSTGPGEADAGPGGGGADGGAAAGGCGCRGGGGAGLPAALLLLLLGWSAVRRQRWR